MSDEVLCRNKIYYFRMSSLITNIQSLNLVRKLSNSADLNGNCRMYIKIYNLFICI